MKRALHDDETHDFLGYIVHENGSWNAQTIFGYTIARTPTEAEAESVIRERGLAYLKGVWQYFDKEEQDWFACIINEAYEHRVSVIRTNEMGYQEPDLYKMVTLKDPNENTLIKSS